MTHFHSSLTSGTLKCGVNLFPSWLPLNSYRCLAFWNFKAGGGKWDTFPLTCFKLYEEEEPICNKLSNGILAESNQASHTVSFTSSSPPPLHTWSKTPRFLMSFPSGHGLLGFYCLRSFPRQFAILVLTGARHSFPWLPALGFRSDESIPHNTLVIKLVGEEVQLTSEKPDSLLIT